LAKANNDFINAQNKAAAASAEFAKNQEVVNAQAREQRARADQIETEADAAIARAKSQDKNTQQANNVDITTSSVSIGVAGRQKNTLSNSNSVNVGNPAQMLSGGGAVYASRGMFIPRGTDTVPAMLTPGEFVVNRASVQRGNNLQVLQAMNGNSAAAAPAQGMSKGGPVYMDGGGTVPSTPDMTAMFKTFESSARMFNDAVTKLAGFKLNIQLDPTNVNVNLNGGTFLNQMKKELKDELLVIVSERIRGSSFDFTGDINMDPYTQNLS
jgi:hypothetical protein